MSENSEQPQETPIDPSNGNPSSSARPAGVDSQIHADTQRSLQQASLALEVTLNRIIEVRRSLLRLSESLPNPDSLPRFNQNYSEIRPGHAALLLAGDGRDLETRRDAPRWDFEVDSTGSRVASRRDATSMTEISPIVNDPQGVTDSTPDASRPSEPPSLFTSPPFPEVVYSRRPFSQNTMNSVSGQSDPAATTRGLRVAAREANARAARTDFATWAQEYENLLDSMTFPPMAPLPPIPTLSRAERIDRLNQHIDAQGSLGPRSRDVLPSNREQRRLFSSQNVIPPLASWRAPDPRRWRLRQNTLLASSTSSSDLPRPTTVTVPTAQSREPRPPPATRFGARSPATSFESAALLARTDDLMHHYRQMQEDFRTDNMGSNINIDWSDDDFISWLFPAQRDRPTPPPSGPQGTAQRTPEYRQRIDAIRQDMDALRQNIERIRTSALGDIQATVPERSVVRRRGWARLDADGDEISPDEEEELERSRTEYRLRAQQHGRHMATPPTHRELSLGNFYDERTGQRASYGSVLDSTLVVQDSQHYDRPRSGNPSPIHSTLLYVDPLPMPLASMTAESQKEALDIPADIVVPRNACLAGR